MTDVSLAHPKPVAALTWLWRRERVWLASALILAGLAVFDAGQAAESMRFTASALAGTAPFLVLSVGLAAWAGATGADCQRR